MLCGNSKYYETVLRPSILIISSVSFYKRLSQTPGVFVMGDVAYFTIAEFGIVFSTIRPCRKSGLRHTTEHSIE